MKEAGNKPAESLRVLLRDLIDYAGLFPPAGLDMKMAVANYARYLNGEYAWMLGRFVLPASRLGEFEDAMPHGELSPWPLSVLVGPKLDQDIAALEAFAPRCGKFAFIDSVETKVASPADIEKARHLIGPATITYYETPLTPELPSLLDAIKAVNGRAKIRTGGVTSDAFPSSSQIATFIVECAKRDLPFKATAGLHHPLRCVKPLTYEPNAPTGTMHGFLNVFLAAELARSGGAVEQLTEMLNDNDPSRVRFNDEAAHWHDHRFPTSDIESTRRNFAISFGSCSFEEPIADLKALNLL